MLVFGKIQAKLVIVKKVTGPKLEKMMKELREELRKKPPVVGAYMPRRGDLCVARFSADKLWYRARVEGIKGKNVDVLYVDFGNVISSQLNLNSD